MIYYDVLSYIVTELSYTCNTLKVIASLDYMSMDRIWKISSERKLVRESGWEPL